MAKKGGKREGAGRPRGSKDPKTIAKEKALEVLRNEILREWLPLIQTKIALANGVYVIKPIRQAGRVVDVKVYKEKPDSQSLEYLFNMVVGKPKENLDLNLGIKEMKKIQDDIKQILER